MLSTAGITKIVADTNPRTGAVQFNEDWPGVFIRGDNALGMCRACKSIARVYPQLAPLLDEWAKLFASCYEKPVA